MSDQDVFKEEKETPTLVEDKLKLLLREDGTPKYESVDKAIDALIHSQEHIKKLEEERERERENLSKMQAQEERLRELENTFKSLSEKKTESAPNTTAREEVDSAKLEDLISKTLADRQVKEATVKNINTVSDILSQKFGDRVIEVVTAKTKELGITVDRLKEMAGESPNLVLTLFNEKPRTSPSSSIESSVRLPLNQKQAIERPKLDKPLMSGAPTSAVVNAWKASADYTKKRLGVEE
jgi:hypothetical protein